MLATGRLQYIASYTIIPAPLPLVTFVVTMIVPQGPGVGVGGGVGLGVTVGSAVGAGVGDDIDSSKWGVGTNAGVTTGTGVGAGVGAIGPGVLTGARVDGEMMPDTLVIMMPATMMTAIIPAMAIGRMVHTSFDLLQIQPGIVVIPVKLHP